MKRAVTLTVVANMTSNYSEGLGNISSVQKIFKEQHVYAVRSRESLKNASCVQAGLYDDLETSVERAKDYISGALAAMLDLGKGSGPMDHGFAIDNEYTREAK